MRTKLTDINSITKVIEGMTLEEKISLLTQETSSCSKSIPDLDIPSLMYDDGLAGVNGAQLFMQFLSKHPPLKEDGTPDQEKANWYLQQIFTLLALSPDEIKDRFPEDKYMSDMADYFQSKMPDGKDFMSFPSGINVGASFNVDTAEKIGKALGTEMRASGIDVCYAPNVDIMRNPLGGRNYEMYSEDTYHASRMSVGFIKGFQSTGSVACAKHFIANNVETGRNSINEIISRRVLREVYSQSFEAAVKEGKVKTIMSAYNAVNGVFSSYNREMLTDMLKKDWGFEGYVVSDWGAAVDQKDMAIGAGLDMITKGPNSMHDVIQAVETGSLSMARIDDAVSRILHVLVEIREERKHTPLDFDRERLLKDAYDTIIDGTVLLKNNYDVLPLRKEQKTVFWGKFSREMFEYGSGSTFINTRIHTNVYDESRKLGAIVSYEEWEEAEVLVYTAAAISGEGSDRCDMYLEPEDRILLPKVLKEAKARGIKTVVILNIAQPVDMREWIEDADAIFTIFVPGCMGGKAAADILYGKADPAGKLPVTFPVRFEDTPCYPYFPGDGQEMFYGEGVFVGYRNYEVRSIPVQFPFGYGLSYTKFDIRVNTKSLMINLETSDAIRIPVVVKNVGSRRGSEVVQMYLRQMHPKVLRPVKELKGFCKVTLNPGEEKVTELELHRESFRIYDADTERWVRPAGEYQLYIGTSSDSKDILTTIPLTVKNKEKVVLGAFSPVCEIIKNEAAMSILKKYIPHIDDMLQGGDSDDSVMNNSPIKMILPMILNIGIPDAVKAASVAESIYEELANLN